MRIYQDAESLTPQYLKIEQIASPVPFGQGFEVYVYFTPSVVLHRSEFFRFGHPLLLPMKKSIRQNVLNHFMSCCSKRDKNVKIPLKELSEAYTTLSAKNRP